jgi:hypothetical protein
VSLFAQPLRNKEPLMDSAEFGAGIRMFQQFVDSYATDASGPAASTLKAIDRIDLQALKAAQDKQGALAAQRPVMDTPLGAAVGKGA